MSALTKILIVLQLVFALVCSVLLVLMVSKQENYKKLADDANTRAIASSASLVDAQQQIAAKDQQLAASKAEMSKAISQATQSEAGRTNALAEAQARELNLKSQLSTANATVAQLTAANSNLTQTNTALNTELATIRPQVSMLTTRNSELNRLLNETTNQLAAANKAIDKLKEQIATSTTGPSGAVAPLGSEKQIGGLATGGGMSRVNGQISEVNTSLGATVIGLPLGTRDGITPNMKLAIYRGNSYVGDAVVDRATPDESVATVTNTKPGATVQKGDVVSTLGQ
ncbi:MAG TPA: hypothetical protein VHM90_12015 [Phycisphaerae bacterium]|nr:hypothetical protein [Phycisphaerae bacterium]